MSACFQSKTENGSSLEGPACDARWVAGCAWLRRRALQHPSCTCSGSRLAAACGCNAACPSGAAAGRLPPAGAKRQRSKKDWESLQVGNRMVLQCVSTSHGQRPCPACDAPCHV